MTNALNKMGPTGIFKRSHRCSENCLSPFFAYPYILYLYVGIYETSKILLLCSRIYSGIPIHAKHNIINICIVLIYLTMCAFIIHITVKFFNKKTYFFFRYHAGCNCFGF